MSAANAPRASITWDEGAILAIDQRGLPHEYRELRLENVDQLITAIKSLAVRGAPAIGLAGALGVAQSAHRHCGDGRWDEPAVRADAERIAAARPTAVNLAWAVRRVLDRLSEGPQAVLAEAVAMLDEDITVNSAAVARAVELVESVTPARPLRLLTHCNTGRLATAAVGTALGAIVELAARGRVAEVLVDETRPLLQGARLTAWELDEAGIPYRLCIDSAAAAAMSRGLVDCVLVGADRIASNGDTANKIGTYGLAVAAARHGIPFVVVAPESTWDERLAEGSGIVIEERSAAEVTGWNGTLNAPVDAKAYNPAFDVTPAELITAIVTEQRAFRPGHPVGPDRRTVALSERISGLLEEFPDHPTPGVVFRDLSGLYAEPGLLAAMAARVADAFRGRYDRVLAVEARGFVLGSAIAMHAGVPLTLARKAGKLPGAVHSASHALESGKDELELRERSIDPGDRVLCVDDVLATGGTLGAAAELTEACGAEVAGMAVVVELTGLGGAERLAPHKTVSLCEVSV
ncbi:S-methyl-5-thioribose-1-phosphate isomerase [Streptomyces bauhiniae]